MRLPFRHGARRAVHKRDDSPGSVEYVIAGLGNPGPGYADTRHNAGFMVLDALAARHGIPVKKLKFQGLYGSGRISGKRVVLLKPQTFMNLSGRSLRDCLTFYKLPFERAIVVYDDVALPVGKLRIRGKGSDGGHNGIKDILYHGHTDVFPRVKVGVGSPPDSGWDMADWVLSRFSEADRKTIDQAVPRACDAVEMLLTSGLEQAMNKYNGE